jgi:hypothetical protein
VTSRWAGSFGIQAVVLANFENPSQFGVSWRNYEAGRIDPVPYDSGDITSRTPILPAGRPFTSWGDTMNRKAAGLAVVLLPSTAQFSNSGLSQTAQRPKIARLSYGDHLVTGSELSSKDAIEQSFRKMSEAGCTAVYWRMLCEGHPLDGVPISPHPMLVNAFRARKALENTPYAWDPHEIRWPIEVAHRLGMSA